MPFVISFLAVVLDKSNLRKNGMIWFTILSGSQVMAGQKDLEVVISIVESREQRLSACRLVLSLLSPLLLQDP